MGSCSIQSADANVVVVVSLRENQGGDPRVALSPKDSAYLSSTTSQRIAPVMARALNKKTEIN